jgi:hypothetical protein
MKKLFLFLGVIALLATTGCIIADDGGDRHARHDGPPEVVVGPPVVVVPAVEVRHDHD